MAWGQEQPATVVFTGTRREMAGMLVRGYALLIPTIGLYRFWLTTWKRRFYWSNTEIDGDPLEYTGNAVQLLLGFLMALAVFVPLYGLFFYLSTQSSKAAIVGYSGIAVFVWYLMGYASYRARDFRLSRTLWRGIRFDQAGSAWRYATRRFFWWLLVAATGGLAYPFMSANLWSYRYRHSWYGDRQFSFTGRWTQLIWPFLLCYGSFVIVAVAGFGIAAAMGTFPDSGDPDPAGYMPLILAALLCGCLYLRYRALELTRMYSSVRLGDATLTVNVRARGLIGQYALFGLGVAASFTLLAIGGFVILGVVAGDAFADGDFDPAVFVAHLQSSFAVLAAVVAGYLLILAAWTMVTELFLGLGFWKQVAQEASLTGIDSLRSVRARDEDKSLAGEGLADALNVGAY